MGLLDRLKAYFNSDSPALPAGARVNAVRLSGSVDELPEWIRVVPIGDFPEHHDGGHEVTAEHLGEMLANFERQSTDLFFDFDHNSIFNGDTKASAWASELEVRDDGLYVRRPDWTAAGEAAVNGRDYRYLSPVYLLESEDKQGEATGAVLHSVALTNDPYMNEGEIDAIGNSAPTPGNPDDSSDPDPSNSTDPTPMLDAIKKLLGLDDDATEEETQAAFKEKMGLAEDASEEEVQEALGKLTEEEDAEAPVAETPKNEDGEPEADAESDDTVAKLNSQMEALRKRLDERDEQDSANRAEALVNSAVQAEKILPAQKAIYVNAAQADFEGTKEQLDAMTPGAASPRGVNVQRGGGSDGDAKVNSRSQLVQHLQAERAARG